MFVRKNGPCKDSNYDKKGPRKPNTCKQTLGHATAGTNLWFNDSLFKSGADQTHEANLIMLLKLSNGTVANGTLKRHQAHVPTLAGQGCQETPATLQTVKKEESKRKKKNKQGEKKKCFNAIKSLRFGLADRRRVNELRGCKERRAPWSLLTAWTVDDSEMPTSKRDSIIPLKCVILNLDRKQD